MPDTQPRDDHGFAIERPAALFTPTPEFGLKDAIALKHAYVDQSHKFWAYFQLGAAAASGFAWQNTAPQMGTLIGVAIGFLIFAVANQRLVVDAQDAAYRVSLSIDRALTEYEGLPAQSLLRVANARALDAPSAVRALHCVLSVAVIGLVLVRLK